jgi:DNA repair exonuclease SbcCD ATPase subunit
MKTFLLFIILALSQIAFAQDIIDLPRQSKDTVDIDTIIHHHNYLLKVDLDTIYLINRRGVSQYKSVLRKYRELRSNYKNIDDALNALGDVGSEFETLNQNISSLEKKYEQSLQQNIENNKKLIEENVRISKDLEAAIQNLGEAKGKIKRERWNAMGKKILWGAGGVIVGTLVGGTLIALSN